MRSTGLALAVGQTSRIVQAGHQVAERLHSEAARIMGTSAKMIARQYGRLVDTRGSATIDFENLGQNA